MKPTKSISILLFINCFFLLFSPNTFAQKSASNESLQYYVTNYMDNNYYEEVHDACDVERIFAFEHEDILDELEPYHDAKDVNTLHTLQELKMRIADETKDPKMRENILEQLVDDCSSKHLLMRQLSIRYLLDCRAADFSPTAQKNIAQLLQMPLSNPKFLLLAGVANIQDQQEKLLQIVEATQAKAKKLNKLQYFYSDHWYGKLALARLGNPVFLKQVITEIKASEKQIYRGKKTLLEHLGYLRQTAATKQLQSYMESEVKTLKPYFEDSQRYTLQTIDVLTSILSDFPFDRRLDLKYTKTEIATARKWLKNQRAFKLVK